MTGPTGRPHRGRRDNGLDAPEFVPLADVDPRIGEHLLDVLGIVGIAAYLAPSADLNPVVRATTLPARPTDRLWVDRDRLDEARGLLEAVQEDNAMGAAGSGKPQTRSIDVDVDAEWERIVAGYESTAVPERPTRRPAPADPAADVAEPADPGPTGADEPPVPETGTGGSRETGTAKAHATDAIRPLPVRRPEPAPDAEPPPDTTTDTATDTATAKPAEEMRRPDPATFPRLPAAAAESMGFPIGRDRLTGTDAPMDPTEDEGYDPPPPPPLPRLSMPVVFALLAIAVGVVLLFRSGTLGLDEQVRLILALVAILGGTGALVWRLRDGWDDDDTDDGAVV